MLQTQIESKQCELFADVKPTKADLARERARAREKAREELLQRAQLLIGHNIRLRETWPHEMTDLYADLWPGNNGKTYTYRVGEIYYSDWKRGIFRMRGDTFGLTHSPLGETAMRELLNTGKAMEVQEIPEGRITREWEIVDFGLPF